ncbi:GTP pyrophosphokinase [Amycolatopsis tolypomycina]|uniref:GTP pyrophosphokinase n=1 Tax=Amycolatopsis tolypomycina TaxID=208445 RepID=UPI0033B3F57D
MADDRSESINADSYDETVSGLDSLGHLITHLLGVLLSNRGMNVHSINYRVKEQQSALQKIVKKAHRYSEYSNLTDLLGIRIITYFEDDVDVVARLIEEEFRVDDENSVDKRGILDSDRFGYLSVHYVLELSDSRSCLVEYSNYQGIKFEVQVRSILQHAWAEIEHDLGYKSSGALPRALKRRFSRLAGLLEIADSEFRQLRDAASDYAREASESIEARPSSLGLDQTTIRLHLSTHSQMEELDVAVANALGADRAPKVRRSYLARQAMLLRDLGIEHIDMLNEVVANRFDEIVEFARAFISLEEGGSGALIKLTVPPGIAYGYLVYLLISDESRELQKIAFEQLGDNWDEGALDDLIENINSAREIANRRLLDLGNDQP